jgi:hypothetical protein
MFIVTMRCPFTSANVSAVKSTGIPFFSKMVKSIAGRTLPAQFGVFIFALCSYGISMRVPPHFFPGQANSRQDSNPTPPPPTTTIFLPCFGDVLLGVRRCPKYVGACHMPEYCQGI